jgi:hypothetical protein
MSSNDYVFEYRLDNNYNHYNYNYNKHGTSGFDKITNRSYSLGLSQPTFHAYQAYPSNISISINKQETWSEYIKRHLGRLFGCFSFKIYSEIPDLSSNGDI